MNGTKLDCCWVQQIYSGCRTMLKTRLFFSNLILAALSSANPAVAGTIVNGSFDNDLSGWTALTSGGSAQWEAGAAVLAGGQGANPFAASLVQGDDGSFSFTSPIILSAGNDWLKFDVSFTSLGVDALETPSGFTDNLTLTLYDADDITGASDALIASIDSTTVGVTSIAFDLSAFIGRSVAFSFEFNDENDGFDYSAAIDNVRFEASPVPVPPSVLFEATALAGFAVASIRRRRNA
ncbi:hypothetical protein [Methylomonas sp. 2B]